jgi:RNA polymerase sigma factor (sigma-70 family)
MNNDWRLLREYVEKRSETAFAQLLDRHLKLVYGTCRRALHDEQLAEDATQAVFLLLAQKSGSLRPGTSVIGWLFNAARLVSRNAARGEARRRKYEQEAAHAMDQQSSRTSPDGQDIEPWLNDALAVLPDADRDAVLLRYVDGLSLREAAMETGVDEKTVSRRSTRAIDKMRRYLQRKRALVASAALVATLADPLTVPESCYAATLHAVHQLAAGHTTVAAASHVATMHRGVHVTMQVIKYKVAIAGAALVMLGAMVAVPIVRKAQAHSASPVVIDHYVKSRAIASVKQGTAANGKFWRLKFAPGQIYTYSRKYVSENKDGRTFTRVGTLVERVDSVAANGIATVDCTFITTDTVADHNGNKIRSGLRTQHAALEVKSPDGSYNVPKRAKNAIDIDDIGFLPGRRIKVGDTWNLPVGLTGAIAHLTLARIETDAHGRRVAIIKSYAAGFSGRQRSLAIQTTIAFDIDRGVVISQDTNAQPGGAGSFITGHSVLVRLTSPANNAVQSRLSNWTNPARLVTMNVDHENVDNVLSALFDSAGVKFTIDPDVNGNLTISMRNIPFLSALRAVCLASNPPLIFEVMGNVYHIGLKRPVSFQP